jgi:hypothetical protein
MANNSEEGQGSQRAVVPVVMMMIGKGKGKKRSQTLQQYEKETISHACLILTTVNHPKFIKLIT